MGNDIDVCSKDQEVDQLFLEAYGPQDEGTMQFLKRTFFKFTETIKNPRRRIYDYDTLTCDPLGKDITADYEVVEFNVFSQGRNLTSCCWRHRSVREMEPEDRSNHVCLVYVHTNTRSLADALEILPLAQKLKASVIAFDLPGCGKSEGLMHMEMHKDINSMIDWVQCLLSPEVKVVVWGRGMGTALVMELSAELCEKGGKHPVELIVLDSPFISTRQVGMDILERFQGSATHKLSTGLFEMLLMMGTKVNGMNVSKIRPIDFAPKIEIPCCILSATQDDYVRSGHGLEIASHWGVAVQYITFQGGHFTTRSAANVSLALPFIVKRLKIDYDEEEIARAAAVAAAAAAAAEIVPIAASIPIGDETLS